MGLYGKQVSFFIFILPFLRQKYSHYIMQWKDLKQYGMSYKKILYMEQRSLFWCAAAPLLTISSRIRPTSSETENVVVHILIQQKGKLYTHTSQHKVDVDVLCVLRNGYYYRL